MNKVGKIMYHSWYEVLYNFVYDWEYACYLNLSTTGEVFRISIIQASIIRKLFIYDMIRLLGYLKEKIYLWLIGI